MIVIGAQQVPAEVIARFWSFVDRKGPNECWPWTGSILVSGGYGRFRLWPGGEAGRIRAHRLALAFASGEDIPTTALVLHSCDNPPCCNPSHLRVGNHRDNVCDAVSRGRHSPPPLGVRAFERNPGATLTKEDIGGIRAALAAGEPQRSIARRFQTNQTTVCFIKRGRTYQSW